MLVGYSCIYNLLAMEKNVQSVMELVKEKTTPLSNVVNVEKLNRNNSLICDSDNYQIVWLEHGVKRICSGYEEIPDNTHTLLFLQPGKYLKLIYSDEEPVGWNIWISQALFQDLYVDLFNVKYSDVFFNAGETQRIVLDPKTGYRISSLAEMAFEILQANLPNKEVAATALLKALFVYCDIKCNDAENKHLKSHHVLLVGQFRHHVSRNFLRHHDVGFYADLLNVSPKYLNRVVKEITGKTAKAVILDQIMMQARRELKFSGFSVKEIAHKLGFSEPEHFSNFFKKNMGCSPNAYRQK